MFPIKQGFTTPNLMCTPNNMHIHSLGVRAAKLLGPPLFLYRSFPPPNSVKDTLQPIPLSRKLLKCSGMVANNLHYYKTKFVILHPKRHCKKSSLGLFLLTRLTWSQNSFIILISRIRFIIKCSGLIMP